MSNQELYEAAFDQWMYDYANNPEAYESMERAALSHLLARDKGEPTLWAAGRSNLRHVPRRH